MINLSQSMLCSLFKCVVLSLHPKIFMKVHTLQESLCIETRLLQRYSYSNKGPIHRRRKIPIGNSRPQTQAFCQTIESMNQVTCGLYRRDCVGVLALSESKYSNCRARTKEGGVEKRSIVVDGSLPPPRERCTLAVPKLFLHTRRFDFSLNTTI